MNFIRTLSLLVFLLLHLMAYGQPETFVVKKASFSSDKYDEFCPVFYKGGIVFCSNRSPDLINKYSDSQNKKFFKIFFIDTLRTSGWKDATLFSKMLKTKLNDGPVTFNSDGTIIYYARNINTEGKISEISSPRNTLGLFYSSFAGSDWKDSREFRFNNEWYNITTPCLSPDGTKLYFASDKEGGFGGSDIYYCEWQNDYWGDPVNLGPAINTSGNEAYPYITGNQELVFSSDGHPGLGGRDIFMSKKNDTLWLAPVHLDPPVNSEHEDFGLVTDAVFRNGYFSSDRHGSFDIFKFTALAPQFFYSEQQKSNQNCFKVRDGEGFEFDPSLMEYEWDFGDLNKTLGAEAVHCFPGPGRYVVKQFITERLSGKRVFLKQSFEIILNEIEQPFIASSDYAIKGEPLTFDGLKSHMPGFEIVEYSWDFGDGTRAKGSTVNHSFKNAGDFNVTLGLLLRNINTKEYLQSSVYKRVKIFSDLREINLYNSNMEKSSDNLTYLDEYKYATINSVYSVKDLLAKEAVYQVVALTSKTRISNPDQTFGAIATKYHIREVYLSDKGMYNYIVGEERSLINSFKTYKDIASLGFPDAAIITKELTAPEDKELFNLVTVYGNYADLFFMSDNSRISSAGYAFLDQIAILMNKYPDRKLLIESHSDRFGSPATNLYVTRQRAVSMVNYLIGRGVDFKRIVANGYGDTRPMSLNSTEGERKKNQRLDFSLF